jgi:hypothetical protein
VAQAHNWFETMQQTIRKLQQLICDDSSAPDTGFMVDYYFDVL